MGVYIVQGESGIPGIEGAPGQKVSLLFQKLLYIEYLTQITGIN